MWAIEASGVFGARMTLASLLEIGSCKGWPEATSIAVVREFPLALLPRRHVPLKTVFFSDTLLVRRRLRSQNKKLSIFVGGRTASGSAHFVPIFHHGSQFGLSKSSIIGPSRRSGHRRIKETAPCLLVGRGGWRAGRCWRCPAIRSQNQAAFICSEGSRIFGSLAISGPSTRGGYAP